MTQRVQRLVEVRCCCKPDKLLGYLPAPARFEVGLRVKYLLGSFHWRLDPTAPPCQTIEFEVARWSERRLRPTALPAELEYELEHGGGLALKREGTTLEELRQIDGFVEARS